MTGEGPALVVVAKECVPGHVKTRLAPALGPEGAARVAEASLLDTLEAVDLTADGAPGVRRVLFLQGSPPRAAQLDGWEVLEQPAGGLDERLGHLLDVVAGPLLLVGMDTPQLRPEDLAPALGLLLGRERPGGAWFGPAADGGFWALGLGPRPARGDLVRGVPMSQEDTGARQLDRLLGAGLRVGLLGELRDVDTPDDLAAVSALAPATRTARAWARSVAGAAAGAS
ncbi:DUF2064 domain-containing protein [Streptomyces sp. NP160]|uniref:TIGR04282 family arsenosugar biosynthesis glycosyltransferase n=1 Tax=Streptomyces sp. NP160 TaxID=2586637 RepID=UPI00111A3E4F|nr:DUF2064 domain-containing protein [Streptomyces sp. NP160]TNM66977.1 DUF2064 domain-containing protein [Streptomyces sp. NP160]